MAQRARKRNIGYGGEVCGTGAFTYLTPSKTPYYVGVHSCNDETHPGPPYKTGGPLLVKKNTIEIKRFTPFFCHYSTSQGWWDGYMGVTPYFPSVAPGPMSLTGWGAKAVNRTFPLHPIYQLGVSLAELKDVPRMLTQTGSLIRSIRGLALSRKPTTVGQFFNDLKKGPSYISEHYLNLQFGWVPFLQDLLFITQMKDKLHKKLRWLNRQNGKGIRRKLEMDEGESNEAIPRTGTLAGTCFPVMSTFLYAAGANATIPLMTTKYYKRRIWFSAKYRFWIPELAKDPYLKQDHTGLSAELLGLALDPTIIYKLTPWSWLLDWFTSAGSVVQNIYLRAKYHVVIEYAYIMSSEDYIYSTLGHVTMHSGKRIGSGVTFDGPDKSFSGVSRTKYQFRQREAANPYGFGITFASLSAYQWSILAALGLTRSAKHYAPRP